MKTANYAPVYCAMYPALAEITREHGYALAIHGSMARDFDLICVPWIAEPSAPDKVVKVITEKMAIEAVGGLEPKEHGRMAQTISICFGECFIDLSFMPLVKEPPLTNQDAMSREAALEWAIKLRNDIRGLDPTDTYDCTVYVGMGDILPLNAAIAALSTPDQATALLQQALEALDGCFGVKFNNAEKPQKIMAARQAIRAHLEGK